MEIIRLHVCTFAKNGTEEAVCVLLSGLRNPIHHIMVVQKNAHRLPVDAEKEPKYHVASLLKVAQIR